MNQGRIAWLSPDDPVDSFPDVSLALSEPDGLLAAGGDLGYFPRGQMVPEFDTVVFSDEVGVVHGPVKTQFGYHLLEITSRTP